MPQESESHNSWLYQAWVNAGFKTRSAFAERLGVSKDIVYLWELGKHCPPWNMVFKIARATKRPTREAAEALWNENKDDPCPCGRGGERILVDEALELLANGALLVEGTPAQLQNARMMPIKHVCAKPECGKIRIFLHRRKRGHPELCQSCCHLAEETLFTCPGFFLPGYDTPQHATDCTKTSFLKPWQIHKKQRQAKDNPDFFFDLALKRALCNRCLAVTIPDMCPGFFLPNFDTPQHAKNCTGISVLKLSQIHNKQPCGRCLKASIALGNRLNRLRTLKAEDSGEKFSNVQITTREQLNQDFRKYRNDQRLYSEDDAKGSEIFRRGLYPLTARVPEEAQKKGRETYAKICKSDPDKKWLEMTKGCMLRRWGRQCAQPGCQTDRRRRIKGQQSKHAPHPDPGARCSQKHCSCTVYLPTELPTDVRFGICVFCWNRDDPGFIIIRKNSANIQLRFHNPCYRAWRKNTAEGRLYIWLKRQGKEPSLPSYDVGRRPKKEEDLKIRWSWLWQHFAGERSYPEIARVHRLVSSSLRERRRDSSSIASSIERKVKYMIDHLPQSDKADARYGPLIEFAKVLFSTSK